MPIIFQVTATVNFTNPTGGFWQRIFDFGNGAVNNNIWAGNVGNSTIMALEVSPLGGTPFRVETAAGAIVAGETATWEFTISDLGVFQIIKNGALLAQGTSTPAQVPVDIDRNSNFIGQSNWVGDTPLIGTISAIDVNTTFATGLDFAGGSAITNTVNDAGSLNTTDQSETISAAASTNAVNIDGAGGNDTLTGGSGADTLTGGAGNDSVSGGAGADLLYGGLGNDQISYGAGNDTVYGGDGSDVIDDAPGAAVLVGNNLLYGGAGNDTIFDATGNDTVFGGTGNDQFAADNAGNDLIYGDEGFDTLNGGAGADTLYGGADADTLNGGAGSDRLIGDAGNDSLDGADGDDFFFIASGAGNDTIVGGEGAETLGDTLDSSAAVGAATLTFGTTGENGTLIIAGNNATFSQIENFFLGSGNDSVTAAAATVGVDVDGGFGDDTILGGGGLDSLYGGGGNDSIFGAALADVIYGGTGDDRIDGGVDNDVLYGGDGNDTLLAGFGSNEGFFGGAGNDAYQILGTAVTTFGYNVNLETGNDQFGKVFSSIETILGGDGADTLVGRNDTAELLDGGGGSDTIYGSGGNDTLYGGIGNDNVQGGAGDDIVQGGDGNDVLYGDESNTQRIINGDFSAGATGWTLNNPTGTAAPLVYTAGVPASPAMSFNNNEEAVFGDSIQQTFGTTVGEVYDVALNLFENGGGSASHTIVVDVLNAAGAVISTQTYVVGNDAVLNPTFVFTATSATSTLRITNTTSTSTTVSDVMVDNVSVIGRLPPVSGNDVLSGGAGTDTIFGGAGADVLDGGADADVLYGGSTPRTFGAVAGDTLYGGLGGDTLYAASGTTTTAGSLLDGGDGSDLIYGGDGSDTLDGGFLVDGGSDTIFGGAGNDLIGGGFGGAELLYGGAGNDTLSGGLDIDTLYGGDGDDLLYGSDQVSASGAPDVLFGEAGNDTLFAASSATTTLGSSLDGGIGNDLLTGSVVGDTLLGGLGRDTLAGGLGNDLLSGGAGADVFVAVGADTITDFDVATGLTGNGNQDNDFVDLTSYYNKANLAIWNAANPSNQFDNPLKWLQADQIDGTLQSAQGLRILNGGAPVSGAAFGVENTAVCFAAGTRLNTAKGHRPIEKLRVGDLVETADHGLQPIRWIGQMSVSALGDLAPILIGAGSLGNRRDILVSPLHRMVLSGWQVELLFGEDQVLAAAKLLVNGTTIRPQPMERVTYYHVMFDAHEVIYAEGAGAESFHPGEEGFDALGDSALAEIAAAFPALAGGDFAAYGPTARRSLRAHEARLLNMGRTLQDTGQMQAPPRKRAVAAQ
jgi:Ca2+-binding RTX toxin-like protein